MQHQPSNNQQDDPSKDIHIQEWTLDGYPVVDNKYLDLVTGRVKTLPPPPRLFTTGPPHIQVYWHNRLLNDRPDRFMGMAYVSMLKDVTEYLVRLGDLLRLLQGKCAIDSLAVTQYAVNVVVQTALSRDEMDAALETCRLVAQPVQVYDPVAAAAEAAAEVEAEGQASSSGSI